MSYNFVPEDVELFSFKCNQHVLVQKEFIKYVRGFNHVTEDKYIPPDLTEHYPLVNSYYEFAEDYDAVNRIPHLLYEKNKPREEQSTPDQSQDSSAATPPPPPKKTQRTDYLVQRKAQIAFLESQPKCFVILGRPGQDEERLGKLLADYWHAVFINPEVLIQDEIRSGSRAGLCIEFNLRCGRSISVDVIIRLLQKRLNSETIKHRGFVLCGFPLIANDLFQEDPISSESAIFNVHEIFDELIDSAVPQDTVKHVSRTSLDEGDEEDDVDWDNMKSDLDVETVTEEDRRKSGKNVQINEDDEEIPTPQVEEAVCYQSKFYVKDSSQMEFIMRLCEGFDYCIIYLKCSFEEVVNIRKDNRYDSQTLQQLSIQRERSDNIYYTLYNTYKEESNFIFDDSSVLNQRTIKIHGDFPARVSAQLEKYLLDTQLVIEKYILLKDPEDVIRLDGRLSAHKLFQVLRLRLKVLSFTPVILPDLISNTTVNFDEVAGEKSPPKSVVFESESVIEGSATDEIYLTLRLRKALGPLYAWNLSEWKYSCPVAMKDGVQEIGKAKYAVHFMNSIFFLSNEERCNRFMENPRPYLLPPMPMTVRRIFIVGPPGSGKTAMAKCYQRCNGAEIIDFVKILKRYARKRVSFHVNQLRDLAIRKALEFWKEKRRNNYFKKEATRIKRVIHYIDCVKENLSSLREALDVVQKFPVLDFSPFPVFSERQKSEVVVNAEEVIQKLRSFQDLFEIHSPQDCDIFMNDEALIMEHLPHELQTPTVYTYQLIGPNSDCVVSYAYQIYQQSETDLMKDYETADDQVKCLNHVIREHEHLMAQGKIYGWIVDGFPPSSDILKRIDPKNNAELTFVLVDSSAETLLNIGLGSTHFSESSFAALFQDVSNIRFSASSDISYNISDYEKEFDEVKAQVDLYLKEQEPEFEATLKQLGQNYYALDVAGKTLKDVLVSLIDQYSMALSHIARVVTPKEKEQEPSYYGDYGDEAGGEFGGEDGGDQMVSGNVFRENRRLGILNFDAVALTKYGVLWKGKEDNLVSYLNKMWLFATEQNMHAFIEGPQNYSKVMPKLPPPRICIVGNRKVGKTTQAKSLCKWLGLYYFGLDEELKKLSGLDGVEKYTINDQILSDKVLSFWQDPNKKAIGFVMNGFPSCGDDIRFMIQNYLIPDCIIELHMEPEEISARLMDVLLAEWRIQIEFQREAQKQAYDKELEEWQIARDKGKAILLEERQQEKFAQKYYGEEGLESESLMSYQSYLDAQDENEIEQLLQEQLPPPVLEDNWETEEKATERLKLAIAAHDVMDPKVLNEMLRLAEVEQIPWHVVNGNMDKTRVYNLLMQYIMPYLYRNVSFLERAYDITIEMAERLLENGYYFFSRFGRTCPVQMYEGSNPLQMAIKRESQFQLFPMIYSNYIYFIAGAENREKFKKNILQYVLQDYTPLPLLRVRIAVIGPPHSGKTTVAERMAYEYVLEHISIGKSVRRVLKYMPSSILAQRVSAQLNRGDELTDDLTMQCVEAMTFESKAIALGFVMDGCPNTLDEIKLLAQMNLVPHVMLDLFATLDYIFKHMDFFTCPYKPEFSKKLIKSRYDDWLIDKDVMRQWVDREYQNMAKFSVEPSRWKTWFTTNEMMLSIIDNIKDYYRRCTKDIALSASAMLVTPQDFYARQFSSFKHYCPLCLYYENALVTSGLPPDRTGVMIYHGLFYWVCRNHRNEFADDPDKFLGPNVRHAVPCQLPQVVSLTEIPDNVYLYGYCVVCLAKGLPDTIYNMGSPSKSVKYGEQIYCFDNLECLSTFIRTPNMGSGLPIHIPSSRYPDCDIQSLPTLGMLEQYVSGQVIKGLIEVEDVRPFVPGLSIKQSALVCLGLILKINNPNTPEDYLERYKKCKRHTWDTQIELKRLLSEAKQTLNPYLHYQEPIPINKNIKKAVIVEQLTSDPEYIQAIIDRLLDTVVYNEERALVRLSQHAEYAKLYDG